MKHWIGSSIALMFVLFMSGVFPFGDGQTAQQDPVIHTIFVSPSGISLEQLSAGQGGEGWLLYYLPEQGLEQPRLVVHLTRPVGSEQALAEVFDAPPGFNHVPVQFNGEIVSIDPSHKPTVSLTTLDGWWLRDGVINYNLEVQVNGPVFAMWGGEVWSGLVALGEPAVQIKARDRDQDGIPDWDLRFMLPPFTGRSYYRGNYVEKKCESPVEIDYGVSPLWPYVASQGGYEQVTGQQRPPIVVDWGKGKITHFSEIVTVRNQNCSHSFYTIEPLKLGQLNRVDFEAPYSFYDLSGEGVGYPNLILRTEHFPAGDYWFNRPSTDFETIRYSWRNAIGDWSWDYKVEVLGFYPYDFQIPLADGLLQVDSPPYEQFPRWVIEREWPVVTFVDTQGTNSHSSEGIYEWSPRQLGDAYIRGETESPNPNPFYRIREGFRGEYRTLRKLAPLLYLSPVDSQLHLLGAQGGSWNLGGNDEIHYENLGGDYINKWSFKRHGKLYKELYAVEDFLIYAEGDHLQMVRNQVHPAVFTTLPPQDRESWQHFTEQLEHYRPTFPPVDFQAMLEQFEGLRFSLTGGRLSDFRLTPAGFRFVLDLRPGHAAASQLEGLQLDGLPPGQYLVQYAGQFTIQSLTPPELNLSLSLPANIESSAEPIRVEIQVRNQGLQDAKDLTLVIEARNQDQPVRLSRQKLDVPASELVRIVNIWQPAMAGDWEVRAQLKGKDGVVITVAQQVLLVPGEVTVSPGALQMSLQVKVQLILAPLVLITFAGLLALTWWSIGSRNPGEGGI